MVAVARQTFERDVVLVALIVTGFEAPGVAAALVDVLEVAGRERFDGSAAGPEAPLGAVRSAVSFVDGEAADGGEGVVGCGLAQIHGEIAEDAFEAMGLQQAMCPDAFGDHLDDARGQPKDGGAGHVGGFVHAFDVGLLGAVKAGIGDRPGTFDPEHGLLGEQGDLAQAGDLVGIGAAFVVVEPCGEQRVQAQDRAGLDRGEANRSTEEEGVAVEVAGLAR